MFQTHPSHLHILIDTRHRELVADADEHRRALAASAGPGSPVGAARSGNGATRPAAAGSGSQGRALSDGTTGAQRPGTAPSHPDRPHPRTCRPDPRDRDRWGHASVRP